MGQKVHPNAFRLKILREWESRWFSEQRYTEYVLEDHQIRDFIRKRLSQAGVSKVKIERAVNTIRVTIHTAKPGIVIGRRGKDVDELRDQLAKLTGKQVQVNVAEIRVPELDAQLVAENIAQQISRRVYYRRAMRQAIQRTMRTGAEGIRVVCSGRLGGAEIARRESAREGKIPLSTLRADVDYGVAEGRTPYGYIGVKVWIYRGMVQPRAQKPLAAEREERPAAAPTLPPLTIRELEEEQAAQAALLSAQTEASAEQEPQAVGTANAEAEQVPLHHEQQEPVAYHMQGQPEEQKAGLSNDADAQES